MSNILNKHRRQDPPEWLVNLKNIFTSKKGQLTGSRNSKRKNTILSNPPENAAYIDNEGNEYSGNIDTVFGTSKSYNTGGGINEVDVNKPKNKKRKNNRN